MIANRVWSFGDHRFRSRIRRTKLARRAGHVRQGVRIKSVMPAAGGGRRLARDRARNRPGRRGDRRDARGLVFAAPLRRVIDGRAGDGRTLLQTQAGVALSFAQLLFEAAQLELQLLDLAVDAAQLVFQPINAQDQPALFGAAAHHIFFVIADIDRRAFIILRHPQLLPRGAHLAFKPVDSTRQALLRHCRGGERKRQQGYSAERGRPPACQLARAPIQ